MNDSWYLTIRVIVFSILLGAGSGVLATALTNNYLADYAFELGELTEPLRATQEKPRAVPSTYEEALALFEQDALPAIGSAFNKSLIGSTGIESQDAIVPVVALTSDGWMLAGPPIASYSNLLIDVHGSECEPEKLVQDGVTGAVFISCEDQQLPVIDFAQGRSLSAGDQLFVVGGVDSFIFTHVQSIIWQDGPVRSSDVPSRRLLLATDQTLTSGAFVFNVFSELVGMIEIVGGTAQVVPFEFISPAFDGLLEQGELPSRPRLGVNSIDLDSIVGLSEKFTFGQDSGALLYGVRAVETGSPADDVGLLEGDIILNIDGRSLNNHRTLDDLLVDYQAGDSVSLELLRLGESIEITLTLGELVQ